jgi:4'-phosphopantetheinyl transferase
MNLYILTTSRPKATTLTTIISSLPLPDRQKILQYKSSEKKWQASHSALLIQTVLSQELNTNSVALEYNPYGKPLLCDKKKHFNLSHSKNCIILATDNHPLGLDVEYIKNFKEMNDIIAQFPKETQKQFLIKKNHEKLIFFYTLWTKYESYTKALGKPLSFPLKTIPHQWNFHAFTIKRYQCTICTQHTPYPQNTTILTTETLLSVNATKP